MYLGTMSPPNEQTMWLTIEPIVPKYIEPLALILSNASCWQWSCYSIINFVYIRMMELDIVYSVMPEGENMWGCQKLLVGIICPTSVGIGRSWSAKYWGTRAPLAPRFRNHWYYLRLIETCWTWKKKWLLFLVIHKQVSDFQTYNYIYLMSSSDSFKK